jgi:hypothetical protein
MTFSGALAKDACCNSVLPLHERKLTGLGSSEEIV